MALRLLEEPKKELRLLEEPKKELRLLEGITPPERKVEPTPFSGTGMPISGEGRPSMFRETMRALPGALKETALGYGQRIKQIPKAIATGFKETYLPEERIERWKETRGMGVKRPFTFLAKDIGATIDNVNNMSQEDMGQFVMDATIWTGLSTAGIGALNPLSKKAGQTIATKIRTYNPTSPLASKKGSKIVTNAVGRYLEKQGWDVNTLAQKKAIISALEKWQPVSQAKIGMEGVVKDIVKKAPEIMRGVPKVAPVIPKAVAPAVAQPITPPVAKGAEKPIIKKSFRIKYSPETGEQDLVATTKNLPPIEKGKIRLYRAENPNIRFEDIWPEGSVKGLPKEYNPKTDLFFSNELSIPTYFGATYGRGTEYYYIDVDPKSVNQFNDMEFLVNKNIIKAKVPEVKPAEAIPLRSEQIIQKLLAKESINQELLEKFDPQIGKLKQGWQTPLDEIKVPGAVRTMPQPSEISGGVRIVSPSTRIPGKWQISQFSVDSVLGKVKAFGDVEVENKEEALKYLKDIHRRNIIEAIKQGKPVPKEVLADYPELAKPVAKELPAEPSVKPSAGKGIPKELEPEIKEVASDYVKGYLEQYKKGKQGISQGLIRKDGSGELVYRNEQGKPVGVVAYSPKSLTDIAVDPKYRRKGVASALIDKIIDKGITLYKEPVSKSGLALLQKKGFSQATKGVSKEVAPAGKIKEITPYTPYERMNMLKSGARVIK